MRDLYVMGGDRTGGTLPTDKEGTEENQLGILLPLKVAVFTGLLHVAVQAVH